jgi:small subunit ribosomal protein S3Ae
MAETKKKRQTKKLAEKKWKGKDWFSISAPDWLGGGKAAETPAMDSKLVLGRVIEVPVSELTGDQSKYYMRIGLRTGKPEGENVPTTFHSFFCINEYVMRMGRKGLGKVYYYGNVKTKDGWTLQASVILVLNRRANANIKSKVRESVSGLLEARAKDLNHDEFVKSTMAGVFQMKMKKAASKIYPVRFAEICKIETVKPGE